MRILLENQNKLYTVKFCFLVYGFGGGGRGVMLSVTVAERLFDKSRLSQPATYLVV
jgi:hypothetical protein